MATHSARFKPNQKPCVRSSHCVLEGELLHAIMRACPDTDWTLSCNFLNGRNLRSWARERALLPWLSSGLAGVDGSPGNSAAEMSSKQSVAATAAALTPYCLQNSQGDPNSIEILAKLKAAGSYQRRGIVEKAGWATPLGSEKPDRALAEACPDRAGQSRLEQHGFNRTHEVALTLRR